MSSIRDTVVALKELQHRPEYSGGIRDKGLPPRVFVRSGLAIVSMTALHHANTPLAVPCTSEACDTTVAWCRIYSRLHTTPMSYTMRLRKAEERSQHIGKYILHTGVFIIQILCISQRQVRI